MSMPIQRQNEAYGIFDDGPRFARDRSSTDLPSGLAGLVNSMGPRIQAGLLNTRTASCDYCGEEGHNWEIHPEAHRDVADWQREKHLLEFPFGDHREARIAVNVDHMDPDSHAYHQESYGGAYDAGGHWVGDEDGHYTPLREWNPDFGYEMTDEDERNHELVAEDDDSGYNWGPEPTGIPEHLVHGSRRGSGRHPFDRAAAARQANMDPDEFIKYLTNYHGQAPDSISQDNIRNMSDHELRGWWNDLENQRGKTPDQLREERQQSKDRAKSLADGLWNAVFPPEEEEGRKSVQNMDTVGRLMDNGWQSEHIKYDEDDQPYAHYQHPSGWTVTDHGGMYKEIGHVATPGEAHDVINVSRNIDGQDYHAPFGPADAHDYIENQLHGDPEETGGTFQYLTQDHPAIRKYKPRQAARTAACQSCGGGVYHISGEGFVHADSDDQNGWDIDEDHRAEPDWEDDRNLGLSSVEGWHEQRHSMRLAKDGGCTCWEGYERVPGTEPCASGSCRKKTSAADIDWRRARPGPMVDVPLRRQDPEDYFGWVEDDSDTCPTCNRSVRYVSGPHCRHGNLHTAAETPMDPAQMQVPMGGGYQIGHRVGLPWRNQVIPGTVIGLDGSSVVTRWDDGQYSTEEPHNIQLL